MAERLPPEGGDTDPLRLTRDQGDRGPSLAERLGERLDRLSFASPWHRMRLKGRFPLKLLAVPEDPIPGDPARGSRLKGGRLFRDGYGQGMLDARLDAPDAPASWRQWVHGWLWLRDLAAVEPLERADVARAEALAKRWLTRFHEYDEAAWAPAVTGRRILMAISHAPLVMPGHDHIHRSAVLNGVARWARHLERAAPRMPVGLGRLEAAAGLAAAALILPGGDERQAQAERLLDESFAALLVPGGGIVGRSPLDLALVGDLALELAAFYEARGKPLAKAVADALAAVRQSLASLSMGDGLPSPWHGGQPTAAQMARLKVPAAAAPPGRESGFQRLDAGKLCVVMDAGPPPPARLSASGHASTLAFTVTDGARRLVVSCGGERGPGGPRNFPPELVMGLRSTAGHSTLVLADTNSSRLPDGGPRRLGGVEEVLVEARSGKEGHLVEARHDGWRKRYGYDHLRRLWLSADGEDLRGEDHLLPARAGLPLRRAETLPVAIRFHLGPGTTATLTQDGKGALLVLPGARPQQESAWTFRASFNHAPGHLAVEPSLLVEPDGATTETQQLLLTCLLEPGQTGDVSWSFRRQGRPKA
jgi:uncharacterized heparinase superfamily protein